MGRVFVGGRDKFVHAIDAEDRQAGLDVHDPRPRRLVAGRRRRPRLHRRQRRQALRAGCRVGQERLRVRSRRPALGFARRGDGKTRHRVAGREGVLSGGVRKPSNSTCRRSSARHFSGASDDVRVTRNGAALKCARRTWSARGRADNSPTRDSSGIRDPLRSLPHQAPRSAPAAWPPSIWPTTSSTGGSVAIKVLKPEIAAAIGRERFLREIEIAARLNHPHIVPLFDSGAAGDLLYYVMPYVAGESLRARLRRERAAAARRCAAADAGDRRGARPRAPAGPGAPRHQAREHPPRRTAWRWSPTSASRARTSRAVGRRRHADGDDDRRGHRHAAVHESRAGHRRRASISASDIYSLACVLFEMLAGQPPFVAPTADALLRCTSRRSRGRSTESRPAVPAALARVVARGLAKLPTTGSPAPRSSPRRLPQR